MFLTEDELYAYGLEDFDAFIEKYGEGEYNEEGVYGWNVYDFDATDSDENGVIDIFDALNGNPVNQHISQGGAFG